MTLTWTKEDEETWVAEYENYSARIYKWGRRSYRWMVFFEGKLLEQDNQFTPKTAKDRARYQIEKHIDRKAVDKIINALIQ